MTDPPHAAEVDWFARAPDVLVDHFVPWKDAGLRGGEYDAVDTYVAGGGRQINAALRAGRDDGFVRDADLARSLPIREAILYLDQVLRRTTSPVRVVAYRGVPGMRLAVGDVHADPAYPSWTLDPYYGLVYGGGDTYYGAAYVMRTVVWPGMGALYVDESEHELVLARGRSWRVERATRAEPTEGPQARGPVVLYDVIGCAP